MKLSVFTKGKALPSSKEEKASEARFASKPYKPETREFSTEDELIELVCNHIWSPFIFTEFRRESDFISTDLIAFDIDSGMTISEAENVVNKLGITALCLPSTSHAEDAHRFRLIFPLSRTIRNSEDYRVTYSKLAENFPVDPACKDLSRFYYGSKMTDGFFLEGRLLEPVKAPEKLVNRPRKDFDVTERVTVGETLEELVEELYGEKREKIPEAIADYLENAPDNLDGIWFVTSNRFLFTCGLSGLEENRIKKVFFSLYPHEELTDKKVSAIINDGYNSREEEEEL